VNKHVLHQYYMNESLDFGGPELPRVHIASTLK